MKINEKLDGLKTKFHKPRICGKYKSKSRTFRKCPKILDTKIKELYHLMDESSNVHI